MIRDLSTSRYLVILGVLLVIAAVLLAFSPTKNAVSVEIGLAELSPRGEAGGIAVPASGGSNPSVSDTSPGSPYITQTCNANGTVTVTAEAPGTQSNRPPYVLEGVTYGSEPITVTVSDYTSGNYQITFTYNWVSTYSVGESPDGFGTTNRTIQSPRTITETTLSCPRPQPATCDAISATPNPLRYGGGTITLSWNTSNATAVSITGLGSVNADGSRSVAVTRDTTFTLNASGPGGSDSCAVTVTVLPPECNDGIDNDGDGRIDFGSDTGCTGLTDDAELFPEMELTGCRSDGTCVGNGGTLYITPTDEVTTTWTSSDVSFCSSNGSQTIPVGSDSRSGSNVNVTEPAAGTSGTYGLACGNNGIPAVQESFTVVYPDVSLDYNPVPPIVPHEGMPPNNPATITPIISGFNDALCYITGANVGETNSSVAAMRGDGRIDGTGAYAVTLNVEGESAYTVTCYYDQNADGAADSTPPMSDSVIFRRLPEIQET